MSEKKPDNKRLASRYTEKEPIGRNRSGEGRGLGHGKKARDLSCAGGCPWFLPMPIQAATMLFFLKILGGKNETMSLKCFMIFQIIEASEILNSQRCGHHGRGWVTVFSPCCFSSTVLCAFIGGLVSAWLSFTIFFMCMVFNIYTAGNIVWKPSCRK